MRIFAHHKGKIFRKRTAFLLLKIPYDLLLIRVHPAVQIHIGKIIFLYIRHISGALIVAQPGIVSLLRPGHGCFKGTAVGAFISHGPHQYAGMVFIPFHTASCTVQNRLRICRIICNRTVPLLYMGIPVIHLFKYLIRTVTLVVRLIHYIKTHLVKQVVILGAVWIMAGTDGIYIVLLHQLKIPFHLLSAYGIAGNRVTVMAVHSVELYRCFVDKQNTVFHRNLTDAKSVGDPFLFGLDLNGIKPGRFCGPQTAVFQIKPYLIPICCFVPALFPDCLSLRVKHTDPAIRTAVAIKGQLHTNLCPIFPDIRTDKVIADCLLRTSQHIHITENAAHT